MNRISVDVHQNKSGQYDISINNYPVFFKSFESRTELMKYARENNSKVYTRLNGGVYREKYKGSYNGFIIVTDGQYEGTFAFVGDDGCIVTSYKQNGKRATWTMKHSPTCMNTDSRRYIRFWTVAINK